MIKNHIIEASELCINALCEKMIWNFDNSLAAFSAFSPTLNQKWRSISPGWEVGGLKLSKNMKQLLSLIEMIQSYMIENSILHVPLTGKCKIFL